MRVRHDDGTVTHVPKVRPIGGLLALGVCEVCGLALADGQAILNHGRERCSEAERAENRGKIRMDNLFRLGRSGGSP